MKLIFALTLSAVLASSCGGDKADREKTPGNQENSNNTNSDPIDTNTLAEDEEATGQAVTAQVDDAIMSAAEEQDTESTETGAGLMLADVDAKASHERYRNCTEDGGKANVEIRRSLERSFTFDGLYRSGSTVVRALDEKTRSWSKDGGEIKCNENAKAAVIPWADMSGVSAEIAFTHNRSREATVTNKKKGTTISAAFSYTGTGKRSIKWENVTSSEDNTLLIQKTVTSDVSRELTIKNKKGETKSISGSVKTDEASPIIAVVEREKDTLVVVSRTIKTGKLIAVGKDGGRVETSFDNVKYTKANRCMATEGKISGAVYEKDATEPTISFEINFTGESKTIVFSNGKEIEYSPEGCVFDDPEQITEKDAKEDVKPVEAPTEAEPDTLDTSDTSDTPDVAE